MKIHAFAHCFVLIIGLLIFAPLLTFGMGVAAIKEQTFHRDEGAKIVVYKTLTESGVSVKIEMPNRTFTIPRQKLAGKVDVMSSLPTTITDESEIAPVRNALKEYKDFTERFPQSSAALANQITALANCISEFESGKVRYKGEWMPLAEVKIAKQKEEDARKAEVSELTKEIREKIEFEAEQKAKGLAKYNGNWIPADEAKRLSEKDQAMLEAELAQKQAFDTLYFGDSSRVVHQKLLTSKILAPIAGSHVPGPDDIDGSYVLRIDEDSYYKVYFNFIDDKLYELSFQGYSRNASFYDTITKNEWDTIREVAIKRFGQPSKSKGFPEIFSLQNKYTTLTDSWEIGNKKIRLAVGEDSATFYVVLDITDKIISQAKEKRSEDKKNSDQEAAVEAF